MKTELIVHEAIGTATVEVLAVGVLILSEVLKRTTNLPTELTRKFAHIGSGLAVLLIPVFIDSSWTVLILAAGFAGLMFGTHVTGLLQGVHGVGRGVGGVLWYPVTAWLTYFIVFDIREGEYLEYAIPVLVLACADAMGAVVGKRWGRHRYEVVPGHFRSIEGSSAFFVVALACITVPLTFGMDVDPLRALAVGLLVSLLATAYESVSVHGLDNLLVPFGTLLFLDRYLELSWQALGMQTLLIVAIVGSATAIRWRKPGTGGGAATFVLAIYTVLVLGGWAWLPPMAGLVLTFVAYERLTPVPGKLTKARYEMGTALVGLTVPVLLVLLHAALDDPAARHAIYVGYLASIACQGAVLCFLMPQHRSFRFRRLRRLVTVKDPWQHAPTPGKVAFAAAGAGVALFIPFVTMRPEAAMHASQFEMLMVLLACATGLSAFIVLAATTCARRACAACGNVTLHGIGCCHSVGLGHGDTVSLRTMTFRKTYLAANSIAAVSAAVVVAAWTM
ncbi:MAG: dolichol kinase [Thermoleophilia bacterium]|nr:dolichol kinase [Thermoleophilia bacterium]